MGARSPVAVRALNETRNACRIFAACSVLGFRGDRAVTRDHHSADVARQCIQVRRSGPSSAEDLQAHRAVVMHPEAPRAEKRVKYPDGWSFMRILVGDVDFQTNLLDGLPRHLLPQVRLRVDAALEQVDGPEAELVADGLQPQAVGEVLGLAALQELELAGYAH